MAPSMTREERETFLADLHVGIIAIPEPGHGPLAVPIWYGYEPGGLLHVITGRGSRKLALVREAGRFSLCAQAEDPPYRYVSVEGPVVQIDDPAEERHRVAMAHRYLGEERGNRYLETTTPADEITLWMRPERWLTVDYGKQRLDDETVRDTLERTRRWPREE